MATSNLTENVVGIDEKVKGSAGDATPGYLDAKVDATTITVTGNQLVRAALTGDVTTVGNAATVVGGAADTVTTNANLTGDVTSVGNATTTVTNANLTGDVTSVGNATTIAAGAVDTAMRAVGTDGEIPTWDASGNPSNVPVGTATDVLTSNGVGAAPTFQPAAGGGSLSLISTTDITGANSGDITVATDKRYLIMFSTDWISTTTRSPGLQMRINNDSSNVYKWVVDTITMALAPVSSLTGDNLHSNWEITNNVSMLDDFFASRGHMFLETFEHQNGTTHATVSGVFNHDGDDSTSRFSGEYHGVSAATSFRITDADANPQTHHEIKLYEITQ